jgi:hypothetical protein
MAGEKPPTNAEQARFTRRTVFAGAGAALLAGGAGCLSSFGASKGATDVFVANDTSSTKKISVGVHDADGGHEQIQTTLTIPPNEHRNPTRQDQIPWGSDYKVTVDVEDGPSETYTWNDVHDALYIFLTEDGLSFQTRKRPPKSWTTDA